MGLGMSANCGFASYDIRLYFAISVIKIDDEILSRRNSENLSEIFFDEVYPLKIHLTKKFLLQEHNGIYSIYLARDS